MNTSTLSTSNQMAFGKLKRYLLKGIFFLIASCFFIGNGNAQGWEKVYEGAAGDHILQTPDNNIIIASYNSIMKIDLEGDVIWTKEYDSLEIGDIELCEDGGFLIVGEEYKKATIKKLNGSGIELWTKYYGGSLPSFFNDIEPTSDGGYILGGANNIGNRTWNSSKISEEMNMYMVKIDNNGDTIWTKSIKDVLTQNDNTHAKSSISEIKEVEDGYFINVNRTVTYKLSTDLTSPDYYNYNYLLKTDKSGEIIWIKYFCNFYDIEKTNDGNIALVPENAAQPENIDISFNFTKMNPNGDTLLLKRYPTALYEYTNHIKSTDDNGYILIGTTYDTIQNKNQIKAIKIDYLGNIEWIKTYNNQDDGGYYGIQLKDGGYLITGPTSDLDDNEYNYVIKTDAEGISLTNTISGFAFIDMNYDCILDSNDIMLSNQMVRLEPSNRYILTDSTGFYSFTVGIGSHTVTLINTKEKLTELCPNSAYSFTENFPANKYIISDSNNIALLIKNYCPDLYIDLSTWLIRRCRRNTYTVNYSNNGTATANKAYAEITFDPSIIVLSSSIPWTSKIGNTYRFDLGDIAIGKSGSFYITDSVDCNAALGATLCTEAIIYPNQPCIVDSLWDKSSITLTGECVGDSATCFTIHNNNMSMTGTSEYRIYVNDMLVVTHSYQLAANDSLQVCYAANGNTIRFEADQRPNHPGNSHPKKIIEGCGGNTALGSINTVAQDDADNFKAIFCGTIMGSFDPNDKSVKPEGATEYRYIHSTDELTYHINFQNTGNDTAFVIVVKDTLSEFLDPKTVVSGASSHPYTFKTYGSGILEWTFNNIMLADSNINEAMSHGFVEFRVKQKANNPQNTIIRNTAAIYFDYNAPVMTNEVWNMVHDAELVSSCKTITYNNSINIDTYPNPFSESITIEVKSSNKNFEYPITFEMYDLLGKEIKKLVITDSKLQVERDGMPSGMYYFKVKCREEILGAGKIVVK